MGQYRRSVRYAPAIEQALLLAGQYRTSVITGGPIPNKRYNWRANAEQALLRAVQCRTSVITGGPIPNKPGRSEPLTPSPSSTSPSKRYGGTDTSNTTKDAVSSNSQTQNCGCPRRQCQPLCLSLPQKRTENAWRNGYWTTTALARSTFANTNHSQRCLGPPYASWSTPTPARSPTTPPSQSPSTGRRPSRPALIRTYAWVSLSRSPSALLSLGATRWSSAPKSPGVQ